MSYTTSNHAVENVTYAVELFARKHGLNDLPGIVKFLRDVGRSVPAYKNVVFKVPHDLEMCREALVHSHHPSQSLMRPVTLVSRISGTLELVTLKGSGEVVVVDEDDKGPFYLVLGEHTVVNRTVNTVDETRVIKKLGDKEGGEEVLVALGMHPGFNKTLLLPDIDELRRLASTLEKAPFGLELHEGMPPTTTIEKDGISLYLHFRGCVYGKFNVRTGCVYLVIIGPGGKEEIMPPQKPLLKLIYRTVQEYINLTTDK